MLNGYRNPSRESRMHSGVASRGSVRISFTCASLNSAYVWACGIQNSYLQVPTTEKYYGVCSQEFGLENSGKVVIIRRAVCDRKVDSMEFRNNLRSCMEHIGFTPCLADPDVWTRPVTKANGQEHYEYVLIFTDDDRVVSDEAEHIIRNQIGKYFVTKKESIDQPNRHLGGSVRKILLDSMAEAWLFSSS